MSKSNVIALPVDNTKARRLTNLEHAKLLIKTGLYIFPSSGKTPLIPRFNKIDTEITPEEREAAIEAFEAENGKPPIHVGATKDPEVLRKMFKGHQDCVWSIACGPSKLVVIDADSKDNGPELIGKHFEEHGLPEGCVVVPTQSGGLHYIFKDPEGKFTNAAGALKKSYGCDVRGKNGQYVSPGSIREDGKAYGTRKDLIAFLQAYTQGKLPELPDHVAELIGEQSEYNDAENVAPSKEREVINSLDGAEWEKHENDFDPDVGNYDLEQLKAENAEFKELYENYGPDCSANRFLGARHIMREWPGIPAPALSMFFSNWPGAGVWTDEKPKSGEYDNRQIAREWLKNQGLSKPSSGEAFGAVVDEDPAESNTARRANHISLTDLLAEPETYTRWIVKHFIAFNTTIIAAGLWGSGKTAVYLDIALHIAHGLPWRGRKVEKGIVVYAALENPRDVQSRVRAWCKRNRNDVQFEDSFVLFRGNCSLFDSRDKATKDEQRIIKLANDTAKKLDLPVAMIIIDTVSQAILPGSDREHGSLFVSSMQRIADATGANVTALHHPTKQGDEVRGDGAFQGNTDGVVLLKRDTKTGLGTIKASAQKFRVGDPRKVAFGYKLEPVIVGKDEDGEDIGVVVAVGTADVSWNVDDVADGQDVPPPPDTPTDRPAAILSVIRERVEMIASNTGDPVDGIALQAGDVLKLWNDRRKQCGLPDITDPAICSRLLAKLVEAGELVRVGENKRSTAYRLPAGKP
ncbi:AAA family ATPase [Bradyrhizobium sp.]|uniref:AAA family ATPase n=1 Tax=Bradyrhizobium sp. TaxID=376 RepID=UPI0025C7158F|nr:AAA family ATPase [Bradyrhizobium sp.]